MRQKLIVNQYVPQWIHPPIRDTTTLHGNPFRLINRHHGMILTESEDYSIVQRHRTAATGQLWQSVGDQLLRSVTSGRFLSLAEGQRPDLKTLLVTTEEPKCQFEIQSGDRLVHVQSLLCVESGAGELTENQTLWLWSQDDDFWQRWAVQENEEDNYDD